MIKTTPQRSGTLLTVFKYEAYRVSYYGEIDRYISENNHAKKTKHSR